MRSGQLTRSDTRKHRTPDSVARAGETGSCLPPVLLNSLYLGLYLHGLSVLRRIETSLDTPSTQNTHHTIGTTARRSASTALLWYEHFELKFASLIATEFCHGLQCEFVKVVRSVHSVDTHEVGLIHGGWSWVSIQLIGMSSMTRLLPNRATTPQWNACCAEHGA